MLEFLRKLIKLWHNQKNASNYGKCLAFFAQELPIFVSIVYKKAKYERFIKNPNNSTAETLFRFSIIFLRAFLKLFNTKSPIECP